MRPFFITSTGTDIGKTLVTTSLCYQLRQLGRTVTALKPVVSGFSPEDMQSDAALILQSCGLKPSLALMQSISPWRYEAALAPNLAAEKEGKAVDIDKIITFCREHAELNSDFLLVEGAGGVMAPISHSATVLDWIEALNWPSILVCGSYLGALSHTLTACEALKKRALPLRAVIVTESEGSTVSLADTVATLEKFLPRKIPIVKIARLRARDALWEQMPLLTWLCDE